MPFDQARRSTSRNGEWWAYYRVHGPPAAFPRWNLTKGAGNLMKCPGSYAKSAASAMRRQRVYTPLPTPPRRKGNENREGQPAERRRRIADQGPPPGSPTADRGQPVENGRMLRRCLPGENPAHGFSGEPRSTVRDPRIVPAHPAKPLRPAQRDMRGTSAAPRAAHRQPAGSAARRQHHGPGAWGRSDRQHHGAGNAPQ